MAERWSLKFVERHATDLEQKLLDELHRLEAPDYIIDMFLAVGYFQLYEKLGLKGKNEPLLEEDFVNWLQVSLEALEVAESKASEHLAGGLFPRAHKSAGLPVPNQENIREIIRTGESQIYEFKAAGTETSKITREIGAMLNTSQGGLIFCGINDDGSIGGSDLSVQDLDQRIQNSINELIAPAATVTLVSTQVLAARIEIIVVPPWDGKDVYQYNGRILIRKGTNVMVAKPDEVRALHEGKYLV